MEAFAHALDELRGNRTFESMSRYLTRAGTPAAVATLSAAARGQRLPTWQTVEAFVRACGQDPADWRTRWEQAAAGGRVPRPQPAAGTAAPTPVDDPPAKRAVENPASPSPSGASPPQRNGAPRKVLITAVGMSIAAVVLATVLVMINRPRPGVSAVHVPANASPSPHLWTATSGPTCSTGNAVAIDTSGSWAPLPGTATGNCGNALIHRTTDNGDGANWIFHPGVGKTCAFRINIPNSNAVTADNVTYQAWDTRPGQHFDNHRIGGNVRADQRANRGRAITITFGPTNNGTIDLQIYDDYDDHTIEVADTVTATCH